MIPLGVLAQRQAATGGGTFSPADVATLALWLEGDSLTSLTPGDPIASWADSSGAGNNATQATSANQPVYSTSAGYPSAYFDGSSNHYLSTALSASSAEQTIFAVATLEDTGVRTIVGASATTSICLDAANLRLRLRTWGVSGDVPQAGASISSGAVFVAGGTFSDSTNTLTIWINSGSPVANTNITGSPTAGRTVRIGIKSTSAERHYGHIFEVLRYSSVLSESDRASVQSYLLAKYGV